MRLLVLVICLLTIQFADSQHRSLLSYAALPFKLIIGTLFRRAMDEGVIETRFNNSTSPNGTQLLNSTNPLNYTYSDNSDY